MNRIRLVALLALLLAAIGCGSATKDEQGDGLSFTFFGFFTDSKGSTGLSGALLSLSTTTGNDGIWGPIVAYGLQNNLSGVAITLQRTNNTYVIPGAPANPPSDSSPIPGILGPSSNGTATNPDSDLPPGFSGGKIPNILYSEAAIVTPAARDWIKANRGILPALPFDLEVTTSVTGITSAGDTLTTNESTILVRVTP